MHHKLDVIITTYNAAAHIEECLDCIYASGFVDFAVIVVDDGSTDDTLMRLGHYPETTLLRNPVNLGVSAARNRAIDESQAGIILFVDSDVIVPKDLLGEVVKLFDSRPDVSIIQPRYGDTPYYKNLFSQYKHYVFAYRGLTHTSGNREYINRVHTACAAVRRRVVEQVRFNERLRRGEDGDFGQRCMHAGFRILSVPRLTVGHKKRYTFASFTRYQLRAARDLTSQLLHKQATKTVYPFYAKEDSLSKKLWLLRPVLSGLLLLNTLWLLTSYSQPLPWICFFLLVVLSVALESGFRFYLMKVASVWVNMAAAFLYFYDGLLLMIGVAQAIWIAVMRHHGMPGRKNSGQARTHHGQEIGSALPPQTQEKQDNPSQPNPCGHDARLETKSALCDRRCTRTENNLEQT